MFKILNQPETDLFPALRKGEIHCWSITLDASKEQVDHARTLLSPDEKERASYFKFEELQDHYIISRAGLRVLLASYLGVSPPEILLGIHKKGKPFLLNDVSLRFNISDSGGVCVYAFSRDDEVGIDIEKIRDLPDIDLLIEKNLTSQEKKYIRKDPATRLSRFFQFWTYKEAYLKAIGEGLRLTPDNLEFSVEDGNIKLQSTKYGFDGSHWQFKGLNLNDHYAVTLAYAGRDIIIREMQLELLKTVGLD